MSVDLPLFTDEHRALSERVTTLCQNRLLPLGGSEIEDPVNAAVEYVALLGQDSLFDSALGRALEGDTPRPDLRALVLIRDQLGQISGLADAAYGAQSQGMYPIALSGNEDQRAIYLPQLASGQSLVGLALLDGKRGITEAERTDDGYVLRGSKAMVPLAPVADRFVVLARQNQDGRARFTLFVVEASAVEVSSQTFVSSLPLGKVFLDNVEVDEDARLGGEGQGLVIAQATLDMFRLPTAAACVGIATQALRRGTRDLISKGMGGRRVGDQQGAQWELADALARIEAARAVILQTAYKRDTTSAREILATAVARQLAQEAAEGACRTVSNLIGVRGLKPAAPWERLFAEVRAFRLESEFLENARTVIGNSLLAALEKPTGTYRVQAKPD